METSIDFLNVSNLEEVDALSRPHRKTIGFFTRETFKEYLGKRRVFGARTDDGILVGYVLFAEYPDRIRLAQLCVSEKYRGQKIARKLVDRLKEYATTQFVIKLRCRRDFPAYSIWTHLGFIPMDEKPGRSEKGHLLTLFCLTLKSDDELGLWRAQTTEKIIDVVIDAQIFFDFDEEDSPKSLESKSLTSDYLSDSIELWITDEMLVEIDRNTDQKDRVKTRERAHGMNRVIHDPKLLDGFVEKLKEFLPTSRQSSLCDINHLAMVAASTCETFVTRDQKLLDNRQRIREVTNLEIFRPFELVSKLHEIQEKESYSPERIAGMGLRWQRIKPENLDGIAFRDFQLEGESKRGLKERLSSWISNPTRYECQILWEAHSRVSGIRIISTSGDHTVNVDSIRVSRKSDTNLVGRFMIADCLSRAADMGKEQVRFRDTGVEPYLQTVLIKMGFFKKGSDFIKFTFPGVYTRDQVIGKTESIDPRLRERFLNLNSCELEIACAPLVMEDGPQCFTIPIRPAFARGLIDQRLSGDDLFGGEPTVLLRWENVYYRAPSHHKMLQAPARILWYVSGEVKEFVAVSNLDEVVIDKPKNLFKKFKKFGILEWRDIFKICGNDIEKEIMAIKFSHTFPLRHRIALSEFRELIAEDGVKEVLQSPFKLPEKTWHKLASAAFPNTK